MSNNKHKQAKKADAEKENESQTNEAGEGSSNAVEKETEGKSAGENGSE